MEHLRESNLKEKLDKCEVKKEYLGHAITKEGLKPKDVKIQVVLKFPLPRTVTEIKKFLGLVECYRKFIKDFAKLTQPLTSSLKKEK